MIQEEIRLPYKIFIAEGQSPLSLLSWRLRSEGPQKLPVAWILVIGTVTAKDGKKGQSLNEIGKELGRQLAETNYGLVIGIDSFDRMIQGQAIEAYIDAFKSSKSSGNSKDFIRHYSLSSERDSEPNLSAATTIKFLPSNRDRLIECMAMYPDAAILIGGDDAAMDLAFKCLQNGRPVFPVVESGGAARKFYDLLLKNYKEERVTEGSVFDMKIDLKRVFQTPLDVEALDQPYKSAIAEIISHLNMIYAPDDPRMYAKE